MNPFFRVLTGATTGTAPTSYTVNFNADQLLGPGATIEATAETFYGRFDADIALTDAWSVNAGALIGLDEAAQVNTGQLNAAVFNLALNGFTAATLNGVAQSATQALNAGNAIDVFGSSTSAAAKALLTDNRQLQMGDQRITNIYARVSGDLFEMGGGSAKLALGGEYTRLQPRSGHRPRQQPGRSQRGLHLPAHPLPARREVGLCRGVPADPEGPGRQEPRCHHRRPRRRLQRRRLHQESEARGQPRGDRWPEVPRQLVQVVRGAGADQPRLERRGPHG